MGPPHSWRDGLVREMPHLVRDAVATLRPHPQGRKLGDTPRPPAEGLRRPLHSLLGIFRTQPFSLIAQINFPSKPLVMY
jgi:hypothetical protein